MRVINGVGFGQLPIKGNVVIIFLSENKVILFLSRTHSYALFLSALFLVHFFSSAQSENACIDQSDQREYRKYLAGLIKKENMTNGSM